MYHTVVQLKTCPVPSILSTLACQASMHTASFLVLYSLKYLQYLAFHSADSKVNQYRGLFSFMPCVDMVEETKKGAILLACTREGHNMSS